MGRRRQWRGEDGVDAEGRLQEGEDVDPRPAQPGGAGQVSPRRFVSALLPRGIEDVLWGPEVMDAEVPAANGFFTTRSLAKLCAMLAGGGQVGGVRLLSPQTVQQIAMVHSRGPDLVLVLPMAWRLGYHSAFTTRGMVPGAFGHFGFGGSGGWADPRRDLALPSLIACWRSADLRCA